MPAVGIVTESQADLETPVMLHKRILEWQAEHPNITWIGWGIVWAIVLIILFWPDALEGIRN